MGVGVLRDPGVVPLPCPGEGISSAGSSSRGSSSSPSVTTSAPCCTVTLRSDRRAMACRGSDSSSTQSGCSLKNSSASMPEMTLATMRA